MKRILVILFLNVLVLSGCSRGHLEIFPPLSDDALMDKKLSVQELRQDVDALYQGVLERHPDLVNYANIEALQQKMSEVKENLTQPMTRVEFFREVGKLSYLFNDGHSFLIWPYQELDRFTEQGGMLFPFRVEINPDGMFIKHNYEFEDKTLAAGSQITKINGHDVHDLIELTQQYVGGETRVLREQFVAARFPHILWAVYGDAETFNISFKIDGKIEQLVVTHSQSWQKQNGDLTTDEEFYYKQLNEEVGYLYVGHFDIDPDWFEAFVDQTFKTINRQGVKSLIIDIRDNTGGNTDTVVYLSRHLADKPFQLVSKVKEKLNRDNRGILNYKGEVGEIIVSPWNDWEDPVSETSRFNGKTYLLVGQVSYSSAIVFATTLKDNGFATLVGQTTGGFANQTGQGNLFNLPNSELRFYVATRLLVRPSGDATVQGVIPDIVTDHDKRSVQSGIDTEIDTVLQLINKK